MTKIAKDVWVIDCRLSKFKKFLSEIKDKVVFIKCGITALMRNTELPNIKFK